MERRPTVLVQKEENERVKDGDEDAGPQRDPVRMEKHGSASGSRARRP